MNINNDESYKLRVEVSKKAFNNHCLIFSPESQKWYTPREFLESNEKVERKPVGMHDYYNVSFFNPQSAILRQLEMLQKAQKGLDELILKVNSSFEIISKPPKTKKP
jgi:hypothetical protein